MTSMFLNFLLNTEVSNPQISDALSQMGSNIETPDWSNAERRDDIWPLNPKWGIGIKHSERGNHLGRGSGKSVSPRGCEGAVFGTGMACALRNSVLQLWPPARGQANKTSPQEVRQAALTGLCGDGTTMTGKREDEGRWTEGGRGRESGRKTESTYAQRTVYICRKLEKIKDIL